MILPFKSIIELFYPKSCIKTDNLYIVFIINHMIIRKFLRIIIQEMILIR